MDFQSYFPIWNKLTAPQQACILSSLMERRVSKELRVKKARTEPTAILR